MGLAELTPFRSLELGTADNLPLVGTEVLNPADPSRAGVKAAGIIDTGASLTVIPYAFVKTLALQVQGMRVRLRGPRFVDPSDPIETFGKESPGRSFPLYPVRIKMAVGGDLFVSPRLFAVAALRDNVILGRDLLQWFTLHYCGPGALHPGLADGREHPAAGPGWFELGRGLARASAPTSKRDTI